MGSDMVNPNILLQARNPNVTGAMAQGNEAGYQAAQFSRDAAMQRLLQSQGANIAAGDQNALNMLAQFDPGTARTIAQQEEAKRQAAAAAAARNQAAAEAQAAQEEMRNLAILHINARDAMQGGPTVGAGQAMDAFNAAIQQSELGSLGVDFDTFPEISRLFNEKIGSILNPAPPEGKVVGDTLVNPYTGEVLGDYGKSEEYETAAVIGPNDPSRSIYGLPDDKQTYQVILNPDKTVAGYEVLGGGNKPSEAEAKIARLLGLGYNPQIAGGLVDGTVRVLPSATGRSELVQILPEGGYRTIGPLSQGDAEKITEELGESPTTFDDVNAGNAVGVVPKIKSGINLVAQGFGGGNVFPDVTEAREAIRNLSTRTMLIASVNFPGRPSNLTREKIESMTIKPEEWFQGNDSAIQKVDNIILDLERGLNAARNVLDNPQKFTPTGVAEAQAAFDQHLRPLLTDYMALRDQLEAGKAARIEVTPRQQEIFDELMNGGNGG